MRKRTRRRTRRTRTREDDEDDEDDDAKEDERKPVEIAFEGFERRAIQTEAPAGRIGDLQAAKGKILYLRFPRIGSGDAPAPDDEEDNASGGHSQLVYFDLEEKKEEKILDGVVYFQVCGNGKKILVHTADAWAFVDPAKDQKVEDKISIAGLMATIDPREEWNEILTDAGRLMRDFFYEPDTHHVDWTAIVEQYAGALPDCTSRDDVSFVIREMISELNVGHAYYPPPPTWATQAGAPGRPLGLRLGARGRRVQDRAHPRRRSVRRGRARAALGAGRRREGRRLPARGQRRAGRRRARRVRRVRGHWRTRRPGSPSTASRSLDGKERRVLVKPVASEAELRYRDWVARNRELVAQAGGRIGYVHVPDTGIDGQNELVRQFMGAFDKDALIIDERWNSGGQIPTRFIELLNRPVTNYWARAPRRGLDVAAGRAPRARSAC